MLRLLGLCRDQVQYIKTHKGWCCWAFIVMTGLVGIPVLELGVFQIVLDRLSEAYGKAQFAAADWIFILLVCVVLALIQWLQYYLGIARITLTRALVTLQKRKTGLSKNTEGWERAVVAELLLIIVQLGRIFLVCCVVMILFSSSSIVILAATGLAVAMVAWLSDVEFVSQHKLQLSVQAQKKSVSLERLVSRIKSAELAALVSSSLIFAAGLITLVTLVTSSVEIVHLLLLVLIIRYLASAQKTLAGAMMRLSRAQVSAGHATQLYTLDELLNHKADMPMSASISRWSKFNRYQRLQDLTENLSKRNEKLRSSREMWKVRYLKLKANNDPEG